MTPETMKLDNINLFIIKHLRTGRKSYRKIAEQLSLSENTIKLHMHHIISKMGVTNRTEAAATYLNGTSAEIAL